MAGTDANRVCALRCRVNVRELRVQFSSPVCKLGIICMWIFQAGANLIERPPCIKCGTQMLLTRIEPDKPDHDRRTFECPECAHAESIVVKYQQVVGAD